MIFLQEETTQSPQQPASQQPTPAAKSGGDDNMIAALSYIGVISVVVLFAKKDSEFAQFHAKQGVVLFAGEIILYALFMILGFLFFVWWLVSLVFLVASIMGFIKAHGGERYNLPVIGDIASKINL